MPRSPRRSSWCARRSPRRPASRTPSCGASRARVPRGARPDGGPAALAHLGRLRCPPGCRAVAGRPRARGRGGPGPRRPRAAPRRLPLNPRRPDAQALVAAAGLEAQPTRVPGAFEATAGRPADLAEDGTLFLQDRGSQLVARLAAVPGLVLDACAAPGGKALLIADVLAERGTVIASEASRRRLATLARLSHRWGAPNLRLVAGDAGRAPFRPAFDCALRTRRAAGWARSPDTPDIRWRCRPEDLPRHAERQRRLLEGLAGLVRPGGLLVYATCSLEPEETHGVVGPFLDAHPGFVVAPLPEWAAPFAEGRFVAVRPECHGGDGFFAAPLRRRA